MFATHRVKDSDENVIGFIIDDAFYTDYYVKDNIEYIDNLNLQKDGAIHAEKELSELGYREAVISKIYDRLQKENPFIRDIQKELADWKDNKFHEVLQLEGSRQTGKTTELCKFAYKNYEYVINVNLVNDEHGFISCIDNGLNIIEIEKYCRRAGLPHFVNSRKTILIIDEIQESSSVYNAIRKLKDTLKCDIIVTGSYLGRVLGDNEFFIPAGTIRKAYLQPLSFSEFCRVFHCEDILENIDIFGNGADTEYQKLDNLYDIYSQIGGYPEVVRTYHETKSIDVCMEVIEKLLLTFKDESRHYFKSGREVEVFENVYREAFKEMCREKKGSGRSTIEILTSLVKKNTKLIVNKNEAANAVIWLKYAGIIGTCNLANHGDMREILPDRRIYFGDCGILNYLAGNSFEQESAIEGLKAETFVYNELHKLFKAPYADRKVVEDEVCFSTYNSYELDFMVADKNKTIYGIEVKTDTGNIKSLKLYIDKKFVDRGIVARHTKGGHGEKIDTIPIYTVGCRFPYER